MSNLLNVVQSKFESIWMSIWDERPSKLFDGVDQQLSIHIYNHSTNKSTKLFVTSMNHWKSNFRDFIFSNLYYQKISTNEKVAEVYPKIQNIIEQNILLKIQTILSTNLQYLNSFSNENIYYRNAGGRYWRLVKSFPSFFQSSKGITSTSTEKILKVNSKYKFQLISIYSSSLFYWYWRVVSNCRHLTDREFNGFPIPNFAYEDANTKQELNKLAKLFETNLLENKERVFVENKTSGRIEQDIYTINKSKPIIDEIDKVLAVHYGFTDEELDFIINYDIKYRMGKELEGED